MDLEAAGGVMTGGLVAAAIERPTGEAGEHHSVCSDCGAETQGNFCSNCGQPTHVHRTLLHLGEELLHGVMHFDARIWRTLPLLAFNPGRLTREWVEGKRTRYVSPLALFLFTIFLMFFILSFWKGPEMSGQTLEVQRGIAQNKIEQARETDTEARAAQVAARTAAAARPDDEAAATRLEKANETATEAAATLAESLDDLKDLDTAVATPRTDGLKYGSWQAGMKDLVRGEGKGSTKLHAQNEASEHMLEKLENPDLAVYKLQQTTYKYAFLLVPLSIPFVALLFLWRRGSTLYDHGVFVLYSLTFVAILGMLMGALAALNANLGRVAVLAGLLWLPVHMFMQLKGAYSLSIFSAFWRTLALVFFCNVVAGLFVAAVVYLGLGH